MIIDIHAHCFPDELAPRAVATLADRSNTIPYTDGTVAGLRASMHHAGVDKSAVVPIATKPTQVRSINRGAVETSRQFDDLICFGTLHPKQDDWQAEIDYLVSNGIPGIKLHPDYQDFYVDDPTLTPMFSALADAGLIVLFHAGVDIGLPPPVHCIPSGLARLMDTVPNLTIIAAHMGGYARWDEVEEYIVGRDIYFDTSYSRADLGVERMVDMIKTHGTDKILFGTDSPWTDQATEIEGIRALSLSSDEINAILGGNALRLLQNHTAS
ncbi:MAG: amidohydrolase family protein [Armatimonadota bacterium]|nr:amidohydrolase family protein [bacterium]